jgi:hypothetical protein
MAKIDRLREEIGWLKVAFAVFVAVDASVLGWLGRNYAGAPSWIVLGGMATGIALSLVIARITWRVYDRLQELEGV